MIAVGTIHRAEDWVLTFRLYEPALRIRRRDGHTVARLVASRAGPTVGAQTLKEGSGQVDPAVGSAVGLRCTTGVRE